MSAVRGGTPTGAAHEQDACAMTLGRFSDPGTHPPIDVNAVKAVAGPAAAVLDQYPNSPSGSRPGNGIATLARGVRAPKILGCTHWVVFIGLCLLGSIHWTERTGLYSLGSTVGASEERAGRKEPFCQVSTEVLHRGRGSVKHRP